MSPRQRRTAAPPAPAAPRAGAAEGADPRKTRLLGAFFIGLVAFLIYIPGFSNDFVYDAEVVVQHDTRVHSLAQPARLLTSSYWGFDKERLALYRPVVTLSFAVDWALNGGRPAGFHRTNALAHALAAALVFVLLTGLVSTSAALAGAALFAVHPVNTEAVASIVGRADIFAALFSFAALLAWSRLPARGMKMLIAVPALFLLALGSKESAVMLPALLILFDAATGRLRRERKRDWLRERAAPLAAMAAVAIGYIALRVAVLGVFAPQSLNPIMAADPSEATRLRTALQIWPEILRLLMYPRVLLADYSPQILMPAESWTPRALAGIALLGASVVGGFVALARGRRRTGLALLWTPIAILPATNLLIPIGVLLAERTLYIAAFAVALGVAAVIDTIGARHRPGMYAALAVCIIIGVMFSVRTVSRLPAWSTTDEVFHTLFRDRPDSYRAQWHLGQIAARRGDLGTAMAYYQSAIKLWPHSRPLYIDAGDVAELARETLGIRWFAEMAVQNFPDDALFLRRLAVSALSMRDTATARSAVERGLKVAPGDPLFTMMSSALVPPDARRQP